MTDPVLRMKALAESVPAVDSSVHEARLVAIDDRQKRVKALQSELLPIEEVAKRQLQELLSRSYGDKSTLEREVARLKDAAHLGRHFKRLPIDPLKWRDQEGLPMLVVFSLQSSEFRIEFHNQRDQRVSPHLPLPLESCFHDVFAVLKKRRKPGKGLMLSCQFSGLVPASVKKNIALAREQFGDNIFIIAEPGQFVFDQIVPMPSRDPLVVGFHTSFPDVLWLIDAFDVTPVEQAMLQHDQQNPQN